jgi:hypothetical protein
LLLAELHLKLRIFGSVMERIAAPLTAAMHWETPV